MKRLAVVVGILLISAAPPAPPEPGRAASSMNVELAPFQGAIPANLANGRPVYQFAITAVDAESKYAVARAEALLQTGMTRQVRTPERAYGHIEGEVEMKANGAARYRVLYLKDGKVVLSQSAYLSLALH